MGIQVCGHMCTTGRRGSPHRLTRPTDRLPTQIQLTYIQLSALWAGVDKASPQQQSAKFSVGFETPGGGSTIPGTFFLDFGHGALFVCVGRDVTDAPTADAIAQSSNQTRRRRSGRSG